MAEFLQDGRAIDWILALVALEAAALLARRALRARGPKPLSFIGTLLSGAFLLLALRNALAGGSPLVIWLCLTAGLVAHVADLVSRWEDLPERRAPMRATLELRVSKAHLRAAPPASDDDPSEA
jgi:hypothetical protein